MRADFIKPFAHLETGELFFTDKFAHDFRQVKRPPGGMRIEHRRLEQAQAVVNVPHFRQPDFLVIDLDFAIGKNDVAGVVFAFVAIDGHQAGLAAAPERFRDGRVFHRQIRVAVEHEEFIAEQRQRAFDGAAGAEQFFAIEGIIQFHSKFFAGAKIALNHFAKVADTEHGVTDAARMEQFELMREKRPARDGNQRLGNFLRDGPQSRGESAREDGDGNVERQSLHWLETNV